MNLGGFRDWLRSIGRLRASLLLVALVGKGLLYIFNPPSFISKAPLILSFSFLVALAFVSAIATSIIAVECVRIAFRSASSWTLKRHYTAVLTFIVLFVASEICFVSQTSNRYYRYGWSLAEQGNYSEALLSLDIAAKYYPEFMKAYLERAYVHRRLGNFPAALDDCNKATELAPKNGEAYACRGYTYYFLCDRDRALDAWNKAISLNPTLSDGLGKWIQAVKNPSYKC